MNARSAQLTGVLSGEFPLYHVSPGPDVIDLYALDQRALIGATLGEALRETDHFAAILNTEQQRYLSALDLQNEICPYLLAPHEAAFLDSWQVPRSDLPSGRHPHAVWKAMENDAWKIQLPHCFTSLPCMVNTKAEKMDAIEHRYVRRFGAPPPRANIIHTGEDEVRFSRNVVPSLPHGHDSYGFHDLAQFMSPEDLAAFWLDYRPKEAVFTLVCAVETLDRSPSANPEIYELVYRGKQVHHRPTGNVSEGYLQPLQARWWLKTREVVTEDFTLNITLLRSSGFHHIFRVSENAPSSAYRAYSVGDVVRIPTTDGGSLPDPWVNYGVYKDIMDYVNCPEKLTSRNVSSKVRQARRDHGMASRSSTATLALAELGYRVHQAHLRITFNELFATYPQRLQLALKRWVLSYLPDLVVEFFDLDGRVSLRILGLVDVRRFRYEVPTVSLRVDSDGVFALAETHTVPPNGVLPPPLLDGPAPPRRVAQPALMFGELNPVGILDLELLTGLSDARPYHAIPDQPPNPRVRLSRARSRACFSSCLMDSGLMSGEEFIAAWRLVSPFFDATDLVRLDRDPPALSMAGLHLLAYALNLRVKFRYNVRPPNAPRFIGRSEAPSERHIIVTYEGAGQGHYEFLALDVNPARPIAQPGAALHLAGATPLRDTWREVTRGLRMDTFTPDPSRAKVLLNEIESGYTFNLASDPDFRKLVDGFSQTVKTWKMRSPRRINITGVLGVAGSGKSSACRAALLRRRLGPWGMVVCPLVALRDSWATALGLGPKEAYLVQTLEKALKRGVHLLLIDEAQKFPAGYLDLYCLLYPTTCVFLMGDPRQAGPAVTSRLSNLDPRDNVLTRLVQKCALYYEDSFRINEAVARAWCIPSLAVAAGRGGRIVRSQTIDPTLPIIVPTLGEQAVHSNADRKAYTYSSCGGLDFNTPVQVLLSPAALERVSPQAIYTAMTRTSSDVIIIDALSAASLARLVTLQPLFGPILGMAPPLDYSAHIPVSIPDDMLAPFRVPTFFYSGGEISAHYESDYGTASAKLETMGNFLKASFAPLIKVPDAPPPPLAPEDALAPEDFARLALIPEESVSVLTSDLTSPFGSELHSKGSMSAVFGEVDEVVDPTVPDRIFQHHRAADEVHAEYTVTERLLWAKTVAQNQARFRSKAHLGPLLLSPIAKRAGITSRVALDEALLAECHQDAINTFCEKTTANLVNIDGDNDTLRELNAARMFIKSQRVTKSGTIPSPVSDEETQHQRKLKPGQTILDLHKELTDTFGKWSRYLQRALERFDLKGVILFGGKTEAQFQAWVTANPTKAKFFANDYTRYDQSCREETLAFEIAFMRLFSVPEDVIDLHYRMVTELRLGHRLLAVFRNTGQWCTLLFNSLYNWALMEQQFLMTDFAFALCGDDVIVMGVPPVNPAWSRIEHLFHMVSKPVVSYVGEFCGWLILEGCILRDPYHLLLKFLFNKARKRLVEVLLSYFLEFDTIYRKLPLVAEYLSPEQSAAVVELIRLFRSHRQMVHPRFRGLGGLTFRRSLAPMKRITNFRNTSVRRALEATRHNGLGERFRSLLSLSGANPNGLSNEGNFRSFLPLQEMAGSQATANPQMHTPSSSISSPLPLPTPSVVTLPTSAPAVGGVNAYSSPLTTSAREDASAAKTWGFLPSLDRVERPFKVRFYAGACAHMDDATAPKVIDFYNVANVLSACASYGMVSLVGPPTRTEEPGLLFTYIPSSNARISFRIAIAILPGTVTAPTNYAGLATQPETVFLVGGSGRGPGASTTDQVGPSPPSIMSVFVPLGHETSPAIKPVVIANYSWKIYIHMSLSGSTSGNLFSESYLARSGVGRGTYVGTPAFT